MNRRNFSILWIGFFLLAGTSVSTAKPLDFNRLVVEKAGLERQFGLSTLECFPFLDKIGFNQDQEMRVGHCLTGVLTLSAALKEIPQASLRRVGISTRFLRTGGFHTVLIPWKASKEDVISFLNANRTPREQGDFLKQVRTLKQDILTRFAFRELYCTMRISNEECLRGYTTLASVQAAGVLEKKQWGAVVVSDTRIPEKDPTDLVLKFDDSAEAFASILRTHKAQDIFNRQRKVYETIETKYGKVFNRKLQVPNVFCYEDLTAEECLEGARHLFEASQNETMVDRKWGEVRINRHNTLIKDDYNVELRFDLPTEDLIQYFTQKPTRAAVQRDVTLSEKLYGKVKNNSSGLRAVCDLQGLQSAHCVRAFQEFIRFLKARRSYRADPPWSEIMFIDSAQLSRVNFALNSSSRDTYIYISAHSGLEEMQRHLAHFGADESSP